MLSVAPTIAEMVPAPTQFGSHLDGFNMERPKDDRVVETMFYELMVKRFQNVPESAKRQMMAYNPSKKWVMVHQDKLAEWQAEVKRRELRKDSARDPTEDSPEWYVKKILDGSITAKQLGSLSVSLRTQPIGYASPLWVVVILTLADGCATSLRRRDRLH